MNKTNAYDFLCRSAEGIAKMFGKYCETVVQEVVGQEIEVVAIYNGHVSGRKVGSTRSIYGDDVSADDFDFSMLSQDSSNQLVTLSNGRVIKSSSYYLRGTDFTYILGINYDITLMEQIRNYAEGHQSDRKRFSWFTAGQKRKFYASTVRRRFICHQ